MQLDLPTWVIFGIVELWVAIAILTIVLLMHSSKLKKVITSLKTKVKALVNELETTKSAYEKAQDELVSGGAYKKQLNDQLLYTRQFHKSLSSHPIEKDIVADGDESKLAAALRHAFLSAEKAAQDNNKDEDGKPHWHTLVGHMTNISKTLVESSQSDSAPHTTPSGNGDMPDVSMMSEAVTDTHSEHSHDLTHGGSTTNGPSAGGGIESSQSSNAEEELTRLRSITENQYQEISDLKEQLSNVDHATDNEKAELINGLKDNLSRQERMMQESETCIKLLETELDEAHEQIQQLEQKLESSKNSSSADQLREMATRIQRLQSENDQLVSMLERSS